MPQGKVARGGVKAVEKSGILLLLPVGWCILGKPRFPGGML
jgi:hypothetical protein